MASEDDGNTRIFAGVAWTAEAPRIRGEDDGGPVYGCRVCRDRTVPCAEFMAAAVTSWGRTSEEAWERAFDAAEEIEILHTLPWNLAERAESERRLEQLIARMRGTDAG